jgi:hypothetical protein
MSTLSRGTKFLIAGTFLASVAAAAGCSGSASPATGDDTSDVVISDAGDATSDTADAETGTDATADTADAETGTDVVDDTADAETGTDVIDDTADAETGTDVVDDTADAETGTDATADTADAETGTDVIDDTADAETGTDVIDDTADAETGTDVIDDTADAETGTDVIDDTDAVEDTDVDEDTDADVDADEDTDAGEDTDTDEDTDVVDDADVVEDADVIEDTDVDEDADVSEDTDAGDDTDVDVDAPPENTLPTVESVDLQGRLACRPFVCSPSGVTDADGDTVTLRYRWFINGELIGFGGAELPHGLVSVEETVQCVVDATDGSEDGGMVLYGPAAESEVVIVEDSPPAAMVTMTGHIRVGDLVTCSVVATDDCSDDVVVQTNFWVNGVPVASGSVLDTALLTSGDELVCVATVTDGLNEPIEVSSQAEWVLPTTWLLEALSTGGRAGYSLTIADDLDGDGLAEIAIGAPDTSSDTATQAGAVYMVYGRDDEEWTDLDALDEASAGFVISGSSGSYDVEAMGCTPYIVSECPRIRSVGELDGEDTGPAGAGFGAGLAWAADADGDGIGDLVASAPYELVSNLWRGRTYVMSGSQLELDPFAGATLDGLGFSAVGECGRRRDLDQSVRLLPAPGRINNGDLAGYRVAGIGDANGDGRSDFAIGVPNHGNDDEGTVYLVYGREDGATVDVGGIYVRGCVQPDVSTAGPTDGVDGVAAYAPNEANSASTPARWGVHLAPAGDFDGDGYDDVLIPTIGFGSTNTTHILRGGANRRSVRLATPSADPASLWGVLLGNFSFNGTTTTGRLAAGFPSGGGGDVNGDGFDDLAFLGRDFDRDSFMNVLFGRATDDDGTLRTDETTDASGRGYFVRGSISLSTDSGRVRVIGDIDGDGFDDIAASAVGELDARGRVYVVYGGPTIAPGVSATSVIAGVGGFVVVGTQANERLGSEIVAGDIDGDGLVDLVLGAPGWDSTEGWDAGRAMVVFGSDRRSVITHRGTAGDDRLVGDADDNSILGGRGHDTLIGGGGADVLYGGDGDDVIVINDGNFRRVRGGRGEDTLVLEAGAGDLELGLTRSRLQGIERIEIRGQTLRLSAVTAMRSSDHNRTVVSGSSGRVATEAGDLWAPAGEVTESGRTYRVLRAGLAELWIEASLETVIPPSVSRDELVIDENPAVDQVVARVLAIDPDGVAGALTYEIVDDPTDSLAINETTGELVAIGVSYFDYETNSGVFELTVAVSDAAGLETLATIPVQVRDRNEAPVFFSASSEWTVEEGESEALGRVSAWDVDADDVIRFVIDDDPSALFTVDENSGEVRLREGAVLDFETATSQTLTVAAVDTGDLRTLHTIGLEVRDLDVVETDVRMQFELRDWSFLEDGLAQNSSGLEVFGLTTGGATEYCYTVPADDAIHTENFSTSWWGGWPSAPMSFEAEFSGTYCGSASVVYDYGTWNANVPVDVHIDVPDEIVAGGTFTLNSTATPVSEGAAFWGSAPGVEFGFGIRLANVNVYLAGCDNLFSRQCAVAVDRRGINTTRREYWGSAPQAWSGGRLDEPERYVLTVPEALSVRSEDIVIDWDPYWASLARQMGLPGISGILRFDVGGADASSGMVGQMDYELFNNDVFFQSEAESVPSLEVLGVNGTLYFENGGRRTFRVGTPTEITVPARGDVDGDGDVDVFIAFDLDASFTHNFSHAERAGYALSGGLARVRVVSVSGEVLMNRRVGPAFEQLCAPRVGGTEIPISCFTTGESTSNTYQATGFSEESILGALDLSAP